MHVHDIRRSRLREVLEAGTRASDLAKASGVDATLITRYLYEPGTKGAKNIGEENARKLEAGAKKPPGWMDRPSSPVASGLAGLTPGESLVVGFLRAKGGDAAAMRLFQRLQDEQQGESTTAAPAPISLVRRKKTP